MRRSLLIRRRRKSIWPHYSSVIMQHSSVIVKGSLLETIIGLVTRLMAVISVVAHTRTWAWQIISCRYWKWFYTRMDISSTITLNDGVIVTTEWRRIRYSLHHYIHRYPSVRRTHKIPLDKIPQLYDNWTENIHFYEILTTKRNKRIRYFFE